MFKLQTLTRLVRKKRQLPDGVVVTITTADKVRTAVGLMIKHDFSQLPVINERSGEVDGVISSDSIVRSLYHLTGPSTQDKNVIDVMELRVSQCIEEAPVHTEKSDMLAMGRTLADVPYVLVGKDGGLVDILTHSDIVYLFRELAAHFLAIGTIEQKLRSLIARVLDTQELLTEAADNAFSYRKEARSHALADMTFDDYRLLIMNKHNWPKFEPLLGNRQATQNRLLKLRDLRNDLFHFRLHILNAEQRDFIQNTVHWLDNLL